MIVSELKDILQQLPQDTEVVIFHHYRLKTGGLRQKKYNVLSVDPCYNQDTNKLMFYSIESDLKLTDIE